MTASELYALVLLLAGMSVVWGGIVLASREIGLGLSNDCAVPELIQNTAIQLNKRVSFRSLIDALL
jgi:hypothetical protein